MCFFPLLCKAAPEVYGSSWARGQTGDAAAGLQPSCSHSNEGSEPTSLQTPAKFLKLLSHNRNSDLLFKNWVVILLNYEFSYILDMFFVIYMFHKYFLLVWGCIFIFLTVFFWGGRGYDCSMRKFPRDSGQGLNLPQSSDNIGSLTHQATRELHNGFFLTEKF